MPAFRFQAIDAAGKAQKGVLDADSARGARTNTNPPRLSVSLLYLEPRSCGLPLPSRFPTRIVPL